MISYPQVAGKKLVWYFGGAGLLVLVATLLVFRFYGMNRFVANSALMEGKSNVVYLAGSVMICAEKTNALPESSPKVPAELAQVGAKPYQSTAADWAPPSFSCGGFSMNQPQAFQYQWDRKDELSGTTRAQADFNGDGVVEATYEQDVFCTKNAEGKMHCHPGGFRDIAPSDNVAISR